MNCLLGWISFEETLLLAPKNFRRRLQDFTDYTTFVFFVCMIKSNNDSCDISSHANAIKKEKGKCKYNKTIIF